MLLVRRLYVYFVSAVSLAVLAVGLTNLLDLALGQIWIALGSSSAIVDDGEFVRRQVSLYAALVLVALPIWLVHWWLAERAVHSSPPDDDADRGSTVRALYLTLTLFVTLLFWVFAGTEVLQQALLRIFDGAFPSLDADATMPLAIFFVAGGLWTYHARVRLRDLRAGPDLLQSYSISAFYVYAAAFAGALVMSIGAGDLIHLPLDVLADGDVSSARSWIDLALTNAISTTFAGFTLWSIHWGWALGLVDRDDEIGIAERRSTLRRLYLYLLVLVGVVVVLVGLTDSLEALLRWLFDAPPQFDDRSLFIRLTVPVVTAIPFALLWLYGRSRVITEAMRHAEAPQQASVRRLYTYTVALVGLLFASIGVAVLLEVVIELLGGEARTISEPADWWRRQVAQFASITVVGTAAWIWHWQTIQRRTALNPEEERRATTRRTYLYLILAGALVAVLTSLAIVLYELLSLLLGVGSTDGLVTELSSPASIVLVASALLLYHGGILRRDLALRPSSEVTDRRSLLILSAPADADDADIDEVLATLRAQLPEGYGLWPETGRRLTGRRQTDSRAPVNPNIEPEGQRG